MRAGVRWGVRGERAKHGEVTGGAGGRNKGESVGGATGVKESSLGFRSGVWSVRRGYDGGHHTIFADNLPVTVSKRELFLEFGYDEWINDIYILRKQRRVMKSPFAFIRFNAYASALRAIKRMNGRLWKGKTISASLAKFKRLEKLEPDGGNGKRQRKMKMAWRAISKENKKDGLNEQLPLSQGQDKRVISKKMVETTADESKRDILDRSLMGVMMKLMNLQSVGAQIHEKWKRQGEVAKLWGNLVLADYRTEHYLSFSVARLLIDSYEWNNINEWINLKVDGREIEIYVKEFGGEIYSIQTHPCNSDGVIDSGTLVSESVSRVVESPPVEPTIGMGGIGNVSNIPNVGAHPRADISLNADKKNVGDFFDEGMITEGAHYETMHTEKDSIGVDNPNDCAQMIVKSNTMDHIGPPSNVSMGKRVRPISVKENMLGGDKLRPASSSSCPFPPSFGPCSTRVAELPIVCGEGMGGDHLGNLSPAISHTRTCNSGSGTSVFVDSEETLYRITEEARAVFLPETAAYELNIETLVLEAGILAVRRFQWLRAIR
ncbi:hypothetical protein PIB30_012962 [Stylosanthes scabra]|uniref:RRM domain-containing protein n=1 Tax=Stylosanthes scabra TaxID=79078 RepID=A0ABU6Z5B9_9FABA|nr:hypothetical protein [Stylosanthes scabra]